MNTNRKTRSFSPLSLLLLINYIVAAGIVYLVYVSGGSPNIYSNLILIPIVLTSLYSPVWHSVLFSALSGLALGPLVEYLVNKDFGGALWVVRLIVYIALSIFISWISTNNRKKEQHFEYMATHDPLTGLPNFNCIPDATIPSNGALSLLMLSFNEDSDIQGLFGNDFYQATVKRISDELLELLRPYPNATLYKGSDLNFAITVQHFSGEESLENILAAMHNLSGVLITVNNIPVYISFRIGFTVIQPSGSISEGMQNANVALRYSFLKEQEISRYTEAMRDYYRGTVSIASEFSSAITNGNVKASYQTIHDAKTREPIGVEILAKWIREDGTKMTAEEFVPILQKTSCLHKLTLFMAEESMRYAALPANKDYRFSINYSASELNERSVMEFVRTVENSGIDPDRVMVELTGDFPDDMYVLRENIKFLHTHKIHIAVDYLSPVFSTVAMLGDIPIDVIKMGRQLTSHVNQKRGLSLISSIVSFAHANGIRTVAEGIENESAARACTEAGVDYLQGYYFSVPTLIRDESEKTSSGNKKEEPSDSSSQVRPVQIREVTTSSASEEDGHTDTP